MRHALAVLLVFLAATGCDMSTVDVSGSCVAIVVVDGQLFTGGASFRVEPAEVGPTHVTVTRNTGCLDQGQPAAELGHGESNFLEVGTQIHTVFGYPASERLTYWSDVVAEWLPLQPASY